MSLIIAYTYEADYHCPDCATKRFGTFHGHVVGRDGEGNPVRPVFEWDEWYGNELYEEQPKAILVCGTCGNTIREMNLSERDV